MTAIKAFGRFWWDFIVGDDWLTAVGAAAAIVVTAALSHHGMNAWFVMPVAVVALLYLTLRRATGGGRH